MIVFLWCLAVFLSSVFGAGIIMVTLKPKYGRKKMAWAWGITGAAGFAAAYGSYTWNLYNDIVGILGLSFLLCAAGIIFYEGSSSEKLFTALMAALIANVVTFMFCGTTDTMLASRLGFIADTPYTIANITFFIIIKLVVYSLCFVLYMKLLIHRVKGVMEILKGEMRAYLAAPAVSVIGFYVINWITNKVGIFPSSVYFFPLYLTISMIFVLEYGQIFSSVVWNARAVKNEAELNVATKIQADMLPCIFPAFPKRNEFDIRAAMKPAKEVGGDFYDFFLVDEDHLFMVVADVSGKGVPAALFMVIAKTLLKNSALTGSEPREVLERVNNQLCENNEAEMFVTVWMGKLEIPTGKLSYASAGHEYLALARGGGNYELVRERQGFVLAAMENTRYAQHELRLYPGDKFFMYSDGVPEAANRHNELFGCDRMIQELSAHKNSSCKEVLEEIHSAIDAFVGKAPQFDDITMLSFEYRGGAK